MDPYGRLGLLTELAIELAQDAHIIGKFFFFHTLF